MGQARKRGNREQRIKAACIRKEIEFRLRREREELARLEREARRQALQAEYDALTPEEQAAYRTEHPERFRRKHRPFDSGLLIAAMFGLTGMLGGGGYGRRF